MSAIRVLVVDDSVVVRRLVTQALGQDPQIEVVGTAANGRIALTKVDQLTPDLVTLDIEMPELNGIETVRALRAAGRRMPVVMFSTLTERGAVATLDALTAGASDYVAKPTGMHSVQESIQKVVAELIPKIHALVPHKGGALAYSARAGGAAAPAGGVAKRALRAPEPNPARPVRAVVIGSSTGGPAALSQVFGGLWKAMDVPIVLVQHMPPVFTGQLAARLDRMGPTTVVEAAGGEKLEPGHAYLAPGGRHLELTTRAGLVQTVLTDGPPVNFSRPSVDVMFRSAVRVLGGDLLAVVLTGMGADGRAGAGEVVAAGGRVLAQDEASSVVWGMPGAVTTAGFAHQVLPLQEIGETVMRFVEGGTR
ncbi:MAG: protein-glutamate methylesterase/protein-glutamine glutaminase [Georgenia sp.]